MVEWKKRVSNPRFTFHRRQARLVLEYRGRSVVSKHVPDFYEIELARLLRVHLQQALQNLGGRKGKTPEMTDVLPQ